MKHNDLRRSEFFQRYLRGRLALIYMTILFLISYGLVIYRTG